jgi:predicted peptidase
MDLVEASNKNLHLFLCIQKRFSIQQQKEIPTKTRYNTNMSSVSINLTAQYHSTSYNYLMYTPSAVDDSSSGTTDVSKHPLILSLHGAEEKGDDLTLVRRNGIFPVIESASEPFPCMVVAPQCTGFDYWRPNRLKQLMDHILQEHGHCIDLERIYCVGYSMGGYATWKMALLCPEMFAAVVPICGGGDWAALWRDVYKMKHIPTWAFHGMKDISVYAGESSRMVDALKSCGGQAKLTLYSEAGHNCWSQTFQNQDVFQWLLKQRRVEALSCHE